MGRGGCGHFVNLLLSPPVISCLFVLLLVLFLLLKMRFKVFMYRYLCTVVALMQIVERIRDPSQHPAPRDFRESRT
jgi:hypothetical protein